MAPGGMSCGAFWPHDQLIAGRKQGHARTADHAEFGHAHAGGQPQCGGAQALATRQHYSTAGDVFTRTANPLSRSRHAVDGHARQALRAVCGGTVFLHDHGVGTGRNRGSGKDARSGAGEQLGSGRAGGNALGHGQRGTGGTATSRRNAPRSRPSSCCPAVAHASRTPHRPPAHGHRPAAWQPAQWSAGGVTAPSSWASASSSASKGCRGACFSASTITSTRAPAAGRLPVQ